MRGLMMMIAFLHLRLKYPLQKGRNRFAIQVWCKDSLSFTIVRHCFAKAT